MSACSEQRRRRPHLVSLHNNVPSDGVLTSDTGQGRRTVQGRIAVLAAISRLRFRVLKKAAWGAWVLCLLMVAWQFVCAQTVHTIGPFNVSFYNNGQSDNGGTSTQDWTAQQIEDVLAAIGAWTSNIYNIPGRQMELHFFWNALSGNTLAMTYNRTTSASNTTYTFVEYVWRAGVNPGTVPTGNYDARFEFSTNATWYFGSGTPGGWQYDFRSVVAHELGHTLGFYTSYNSITDRFASGGLTAWDRNLIDSAGNRPARNSTGTPGNFNQTDDPVYFTGANAVALYGGNVPVYAPATYTAGSSLTHLDETLLPNALMSPLIAGGQVVRAPTQLEWAIMKDLGWNVTATKTWSNTSGNYNWGDAANWTPAGVPDQTYNVVFTNTGLAAGSTVDLGGDRQIKTLQLDATVAFTIGGTSGTLTIQDGNLTRTSNTTARHTINRPVVLGSDATWSIAGTDGRVVLTSSLSSNFELAKTGTGMLTLAGPANVAEVILSEGDLTLASGATLTTGKISGQGMLNLDGGTLNLTGSNTIQLWGLRVGKEAPGSFTLAPGMTLVTSTFVTVGRDNGGQGTLVNEGNIVAQSNLFVGVYTGSTGLFIQRRGSGQNDPLPATTVADTTYIGYEGGVGTFELHAGTYTTNKLLIGPGSQGVLTQTGGTLTVGQLLQIGGTSSPGTYNLNGGTLVTGSLTTGGTLGAFNFGGGTLRASANLSSSVPITLKAAGGTIDTNGFTVTLSGALSGPGSLTKTGAGTLRLTGTNSYSGGTLIQQGTLVASSDGNLGDAAGGLSFSGGVLRWAAGFDSARSISLLAGGGVLDTGVEDVTLSGTISGVGSLTKTGAGTLRLTGTNSYSGGTLIQQGTLVASSDGNLGDAAGGLSFSGGVLRWAAGFDSARSISLLAGGGVLDTGVEEVTLSGTISGAGSLTKTGPGVLRLSGSNSYSGGTLIQQGTLVATSDGNLGDAAGGLSFSGGVLRWGAGFDSARSISLLAGGGVLDTGVEEVTLSGTISGAGSLTKTGPGVLRLSGANSYSGGTLIQQGTLVATSDGNLGDAAGGLSFSGGVLRWAAGFDSGRSISLLAGGGVLDTGVEDVTLSGTISGAGSLTKTGPGVLRLSGANSYSGGTLIQQGTLVASSDGNLGDAAGSLSFSGGTLRWGAGFDSARSISLLAGGGVLDTGVEDVTLSGTISGAGSLTKTGPGVLRLSGANSYSGGTLIQQGTLVASSDANLGDAAGSLSFSGGTLRWGAGFDSARSISLLAGGGVLDTGVEDVTLSGTISGAGSLTKTGAGTLRLTGTNTYSGGTLIQQGTLVASSDGNLGDAAGGLSFSGGVLRWGAGFDSARSISLLAGGGVLDTGVEDVTLSGTISGAGSLTKRGEGLLRLTVAPRYLGSTVVSAGTLLYQIDEGSPSVGEVASLTIADGAAVIASGTVDPFTDSLIDTRHLDVLNDGRLEILAGVKQLASLDGQGEVIVAAGASLTASLIRQSSITIGGEEGNPARLVFRSSFPPDGDGQSLAGALAAVGAGPAVPEPSAITILLSCAVFGAAAGWGAFRAKRRRRLG